MKMINFKVALIALILGISSAFAFKANAIINSRTTYTWYATSTDRVNFHWVTSPPANTTCSTSAGTCEITTTVAGTPPANGYPSSYTVVSGANKAYVPN